MAIAYSRQIIAAFAIASVLLSAISCRVVATSGEFYGSTTPPSENILRYVNGDEPESLDPAISSGQPEARIYMALYQGLVEYHPRTLSATPALAERWSVNSDTSEFVFRLRRNARWSNGDPITAQDFVYSIRRGLSPKLASKNAYLAYYITYAQAYNENAVFAKDKQTQQFVLQKDAGESQAVVALSQQPDSIGSEYQLGRIGPQSLEGPDMEAEPGADTAFHHLMHSPLRLTLPGDEKARNALLAKNPKLQAAVAGKEFVEVSGEDIGVEAVDDYTVRISLSQPAAYFLDMLSHQLFRFVPRNVIQAYGDRWTDPAHIVTCGPFRVKAWRQYNELVVERDPMYWDAANVHLDEIYFFVNTDNPTAMNLYKVGEADALLNHGVPNSWLRVVRPKKDYMDGGEAALAYISMNVTKPPMNDVRVRKAFNLAIDKVLYSKSRLTTLPLSGLTPEGIFVGYPQPKPEGFDPESARRLLGEAGFPVIKKNDSFECPNFPVAQVEFIFNTGSSNKGMAEFMQAQWKQNLGITVALRSMESKTFMNTRSKLDYKGFAVFLWGADYMDPFSFLGIFTTPGGVNGTGWYDLKYVAMLDEANRTADHQKRYELLAKAEKYALDVQPVIPIETFSVNWLKKPYVKGMYPNPGGLYAWKYVYIERDSSKWDYGVPSLAD